MVLQAFILLIYVGLRLLQTSCVKAIINFPIVSISVFVQFKELTPSLPNHVIVSVSDILLAIADRFIFWSWSLSKRIFLYVTPAISLASRLFIFSCNFVAFAFASCSAIYSGVWDISWIIPSTKISVASKAY